jgi:hypothetical protein
MWIVEHVPGYSGIDHLGGELADMANSYGPFRTRREAERAIARTYQLARQLAVEAPTLYGAFKGTFLPLLRAVREEK